MAEAIRPSTHMNPHNSSTQEKLHIAQHVHNPRKLTIALVGFGSFGQFLGRRMIRQGHSVLATSRSDYTEICQAMGVSFFKDPRDLCKENPDAIVLCTAILAAESTLQSLPFEELRSSNTLFVDVLSVKEFPRNLFLKVLPTECGILCTHPMFGPESGRESWAGLRFAYERVRIPEEGICAQKCTDFLAIFEFEGCEMVEMTCAQHDYYAARTQFLTHTVGRILSHMELETTPIDTKSYQTLRHLTESMAGHSEDLYNGLFLYNANAKEEIRKLEVAFDSLKVGLFRKLQGSVNGEQHVDGVVDSEAVISPPREAEPSRQ